MNEELQKRMIEDMMKRPIPRKRVEIVKLQMIRVGSVLYGTRRFTSAEEAVEAVRPMLSKTDREMMTFIVLERMESLRSFQRVMQLLEGVTEWKEESPAAPERLEIFRDLSPFMHAE